MKRLISLLAATAASAAVTAAITLPAGASDDPAPTTKDARFVACLRDHGLAIPADTTGDAIKGWLLAHDGVDDAIAACKPRDGGRDVNVAKLTACLRDHGLNPPADVEQLKPWLAQQDPAAVKLCGFDAPRKEDHGDKPCGPQPAAEAAKRQ
jgi:hypothetical protein